MGRFSLTRRITGIIILVAILSASVSGIMNLLIARSQFANYVDVSTLNRVEDISYSMIAYYDRHETLAGVQDYSFIFGQGTGNGRMNRTYSSKQAVRYFVTDLDNKVVADSASAVIGEEVDEITSDLKGYPITLANGEIIGNIYISSPISKGIESLENTFLYNISIQTIISIILVAFIALLLGLFLTRGIVFPLSELSGGIHTLAKGNLGVRVKPRGDKELYSLGEDFNQMAEKLSNHEETHRALVSNIAHELRTPLSILRGQMEAIQTGRLKPTEEISSGLVDEMIRLTRLVSDLETIGLAEGGVLTLNKMNVSLNEIKDSLFPLRLAMEEKGIAFSEQYDPAIEHIVVDRNRLTQILINLLSNAIRHVDGGGSISLKIWGDENNIRFTVADNGSGIRNEDILHVFERFYRSDDKRNVNMGGTGLGLAIAKSYVEAHGGEIWAESEPGKGASFIFTIPA